MGNTMPVVIQDKNGKTTTVHRKDIAAPSTSAHSVPAPSIAPQTSPQGSNERLIALVEDRHPIPLPRPGEKNKVSRFKSVYAGASEKQVQESLDFILGETPELGPLAEKLMTTGSTAAKELAKDSFSEMVNHIASVIDERETDPDWDNVIPYGDELKATLIKEWSVGIVADASGIYYDRSLLKGAIVDAGFIDRLYRRDSAESPTREEVYWRGIAAFALSDIAWSVPNGLPEYSREFIDWSGSRSDLSDILRVVNERGVLNPETIEGLLSQKDVENTLRDGIL